MAHEYLHILNTRPKELQQAVLLQRHCTSPLQSVQKKKWCHAAAFALASRHSLEPLAFAQSGEGKNIWIWIRAWHLFSLLSQGRLCCLEDCSNGNYRYLESKLLLPPRIVFVC